MGEVYLARQLSLDRPVALKVLRPELLSNPTYMARFEAEAWAAAKLNHPNIVHIYTLGGFEGLRFIAMEYVQGTNLKEYLAKKGVPDLPLAMSIMRQAGQAVGAAGEIGLVHRDIKPENLLLTRKGQVKVADFGLCRRPGADKLNLTQPGVTLGTPMYMSPEQVQGHALDHRSDLYSLGVTFYHMLAGFPPFQAETAVALALKHVRDKPVDLAVHRPDLPPDLCRLVMKLLEKDPIERYQSATEMLRDLSKIKEQIQAQLTTQPSLEITSKMVSDASAAVTRTESTEATRPSKAWKPPRWSLPRVGKGTLVILGLVAMAAGSAWGWYDRADDLLGPRAPGSTALPGLWIDRWETLPRLPSPESQYRYAQTQATEASRQAAWLAVPGYFPDAIVWSEKAYVQLARQLLRAGDAERLEILGKELSEGEPSRSENSRLLGRISQAGAAALRGDAPAVIDQFLQISNFNLLDPALAELGLEVVLTARRKAPRPPDNRLVTIRNNLLAPLHLDPLVRQGFESLN